MTFAWQRAKSAWEEQTQSMSFETLLGRYVAEGCLVWSTPQEFLLACPVVVAADGSLTHNPERADAWYLHLAALADPVASLSDLVATFLRVAPHPLKWVVWHRARTRKLHRHSWEVAVQQAQRTRTGLLTYGKS